MKKKMNESGVTLVMVITILLIITIAVPSLINWVRQETKDTVKVKRSSHAFHLAEAGVDQGIWKLQESMAVWTAAKAGTVVADYDGNTQFSLQLSSGSMGSYTVRFSSGPSADQVTVLGKGRDVSTMEIRAIQAVVEENGAGTFSIRAKKTSSFGGSTQVEWGPVIAEVSIDPNGLDYPRFMSAGNVVGKDPDGTAAGINTDGVQWWSFKQDLPPTPLIDLVAYQSSSSLAGVPPDSDCGPNYYQDNAGSTFDFTRCEDTTGHTFYLTGGCNFKTGGSGNYIVGNVLCMQTFNIQGNGGGKTTEVNKIPSEAWKEYGYDATTWAHYKTFDPTAPATYAAALATNYEATGKTYSIDNVLIHGFMYTGSGQSLTGGGTAVLVGALYSAQNTAMTTSNATLYYDEDVASSVQTTNVIITRESWKEVTGQSFP